MTPRSRQSNLPWLERKSSGNGQWSHELAESGGRISDLIAERIRTAVSDGILAPGSRLLSERELAQRLNASRESVREAYRSLEVAGLLVIRRGKEGGADEYMTLHRISPEQIQSRSLHHAR